MNPLRIGALGAARITPRALCDPAREVADVEVTAVAARDPERARAFAEEHGIPRVLGSYSELVHSPEIDAVYNALPISHHCEWSIRALEAGKHVLCEKAFALNASEAERMAEAAHAAGRALVEAFHYRYHPLMERVLEIVRAGELGTIEHLEGRFLAQIPNQDDIRFNYATGGGSTMDLGCYPIHMVRHTSGEEPEVVSAEAVVGPDRVDVAMEAELRFPSGASGRVSSSMQSDGPLVADLRVRGADGELHVRNPLAPHFGHKLRVKGSAGEREETVEGGTTYLHQLQAFASHVRTGAAVPTGPEDAIANMKVIDAVYRAAGLPPRGS